MNSRPFQSEPGLLESIDFRAFLETVRLRWWIIPIILGISAGFLAAQESDLRTTAPTYYVSKSYEIPDVKRVLLELQILPETIVEFPNPESQLILLASDPVKEEISEKLGREIRVEVPKTYAPPFVFSCNQPVEADCDRAIDAYVDKYGQIRKEAITAGLESLQRVLTSVPKSDKDILTPSKIAAVNALLSDLDAQLVQIDSVVEAVGPTVRNVSRTTYVFAMSAGLFVAMLILLQLTYSDSRIRSARQAARLMGVDSFIGTVSRKDRPVRDRNTSVGLYRGMSRANAQSLRFVPLRKSIVDQSGLLRITEMLGSNGSFSKPVAEMSVIELTQPQSGEVDVLVVQRNRDLRKDAVDALATLTKSGRQIAGVLLID